MKKLIYLFLAVIMTALLTGCAEEQNDPVSSDENVIIEGEYAVGKTYQIKRHFPNPYNAPAYLIINGESSNADAVKFTKQCGEQYGEGNGQNSSFFERKFNTIDAKGCDIEYTYTPANLSRSNVTITYSYYKENPNIICEDIENTALKDEDKIKKIESLNKVYKKYVYIHYAMRSGEKNYRTKDQHKEKSINDSSEILNKKGNIQNTDNKKRIIEDFKKTFCQQQL